MKVKFKKIHPDAVIPSYAKPGDFGLDLTAVSVINKNAHQVMYDIEVVGSSPIRIAKNEICVSYNETPATLKAGFLCYGSHKKSPEIY